MCLLFAVLILVSSCMVTAVPVKAESRTIVVPDDYSTIETAIQNATDGDTIFVKSGVYQENPLKINKTLSVIGEGADSTKISFDPPSTEVTVNILERYIFYEDPIDVYADGFTLSGFTITSTGGSISISGNKTRITDNVITPEIYVAGGRYSLISQNSFLGNLGFNGTYCRVNSNNFWGNLYGGGQYVIFSFNNGHSGIRIEGSNCLITNNHLIQSSSWFSVSGNDNVITKNTIDHVGFGLSVAGLNSKAFLNQISHCGIGLIPSAGSVIFANNIADCGWGIDTGGDLINPNGTLSTVFHNNFINNRYQVDAMGHYEADYYDNGKEGNFWNDYNGSDTNGDGIGDTPYRIDENRSDRYPLIKPFNLSSVPDTIPDWAAPPSVHLISPQNTTYDSANITLNFFISKQASVTYSLDGASNITATANTTLANLPSGSHNITLYTKDVFDNIGASETINFTVASPPFPTVPVVAVSGVLVAVACVFIFLYVRKKQR